jgi:hypothetical protein
MLKLVRTSLCASAFLALNASAQTATNHPVASQPGPSTPITKRFEKRSWTITDYAKWRTIKDVALSDDGNWVTFGYGQRKSDDTLVIRNLAGGAETRVGRASRPQFSDDAKWVAYFVTLPIKEVEKLRKDRKPVPEKVELRNLSNNQTFTWDNAASFSFNKGSTVLLVKKTRPPNAAAPTPPPGTPPTPIPAFEGVDVILHHLADGADELIGSVSSAEFNKPGTYLAYTVSSTDGDGNGLFLLSTSNFSRRPLDNAKANYARVSWDEDGMAVAALRGLDVKDSTQKSNTLIAFTGLDGGQPTSFVFGPGSLAGMPSSMVLSEKSPLVWSKDKSKIFLGLKEQEFKVVPKKDSVTGEEEPVANVDVWHWKDDRLQSVQMLAASRERDRTLAAALHLSEKKIVKLADSAMASVTIGRDGLWAVGQDDKPYVHDWHPQLFDIYKVSTTSGTRSPVLKGIERTYGLSADGKYYLYWKEKHFWSYDMTSGEHKNITKSAPVSFVNVDEDHFGEKPAYGLVGYTTDGNSVLVMAKYDLWAISLNGSAAPRNLTNGEGAKNNIRFRWESMRPFAFVFPPAPDTIDLSKPMYLTAFGEHDKKGGFYVLNGGQLTKLVYEDHLFGRPQKAKNADRIVITRESFTEFPDYYVTDTRLSSLTKLTNANPQMADIKWGKRILFSYKDKDGHPLYGTLAIPEGYQKGEKLPMLVDFYEKNSQNLNRFETPRFGTAPAYGEYLSNGYLVMVPDVYYHTGRSHSDMLHSVEAAVRKVIELGYADPKRIGLHGHSYSGQGAAFISTQSKLFAAIMAGAAATNLVSDFNQLWKGAGTNQHRYDTYGQGRFATNIWDGKALYESQSAVHNARGMNTPLLLLHGTQDGAVEWLQAIEFYNALRFLGKPVILLSYEGEDHGLGRYENQYDSVIRMKEFYDHFLKGAPAADWIRKGIPFLKKKKPTGEAAQPIPPPTGGWGIGGTGGGSGN